VRVPHLHSMGPVGICKPPCGAAVQKMVIQRQYRHNKLAQQLLGCFDGVPRMLLCTLETNKASSLFRKS
jgi:hypothetical protein